MFQNTTYQKRKYHTKRHKPASNGATETTHLYCNAQHYRTTLETQSDYLTWHRQPSNTRVLMSVLRLP